MADTLVVRLIPLRAVQFSSVQSLRFEIIPATAKHDARGYLAWTFGAFFDLYIQSSVPLGRGAFGSVRFSAVPLERGAGFTGSRVWVSFIL